MKRIYLILAGIFTILIVLLLLLRNVINTKNQEIARLVSNENALYSQIDNNKTETMILHYSLNELKAYETVLYDSIKVLAKQLNIKPKEIIRIEHITSTATTHDTITVKDITKIDTCYGIAPWYEHCLKTDSTSFYSNYTINSDLYILYSNSKQTINPRKPWPLYWFQKKHIVTTINIEEKNPYITTTSSKVIELQN